jgi:hypothetical protein
MARDLFGDLSEWGRVLDQLEQLSLAGQLDEHQAGMARILRFRQNWQLTERVLALATGVKQSNDLLTAEVVHVLADVGADIETRVLAAKAIGHLLRNRPPQGTSRGFDPDRVIQNMKATVAGSNMPVLQRAVADALSSVAGASGTRN